MTSSDEGYTLSLAELAALYYDRCTEVTNRGDLLLGTITVPTNRNLTLTASCAEQALQERVDRGEPCSIETLLACYDYDVNLGRRSFSSLLELAYVIAHADKLILQSADFANYPRRVSDSDYTVPQVSADYTVADYMQAKMPLLSELAPLINDSEIQNTKLKPAVLAGIDQTLRSNEAGRKGKGAIIAPLIRRENTILRELVHCLAPERDQRFQAVEGGDEEVPEGLRENFEKYKKYARKLGPDALSFPAFDRLSSTQRVVLSNSKGAPPQR